MTTIVIFRQDKKTGELLAIFPFIAATMNPEECMSYDDSSGHGAANLNWCLETTNPSSYFDLHRSVAKSYVRFGGKGSIPETFYEHIKDMYGELCVIDKRIHPITRESYWTVYSDMIERSYESRVKQINAWHRL